MHQTTTHPAIVNPAIFALDVDQLGRPLSDPDAIRAGIPDWHPRADGEGDGGGDGGDGGTGGDAGGAGDGDGGQGAGGQGDGETFTPPTKAEWDNIQRERREAREEADRLKREKDERERKEAEDAGNYQTIAEQEKARADAAEARALKVERETRVSRIATRLKFKDPADVLHRLSDNVLDDDSKVEKSLKDIAKAKPYLVEDAEKPRQRDLGGGDGGGAGDVQVTGPDRLSRAYASQSTS